MLMTLAVCGASPLLTPAQVPPESPRLILEGLPGQIDLVAVGDRSVYRSSQPVQCRVRSELPIWRLVVVATDLTSSNGSRIKSNDLILRQVGSEVRPGPETATLGRPVMLTEGPGNRGRGTEALKFFVENILDIKQPTGVYVGSLQFFFDFGAGAPPMPAGIVPIRLEVNDIFYITVEGGLDFGSAGCSEHNPAQPVRIQITTNQPAREVVFALEEIRSIENGQDAIPSSCMALGIGKSAERARLESEHNRLGTDTIRWRLPEPGVHILYLDARIDMKDPASPGRYQGTIMITAGGF